LLTIVASHPFTPQEVREVDDNLAQYVEWETDTVEWLKNEFGAEFKLAVRHMDESRMHIHAYVLPSDSKANELHPGARAKRCATDEALKQGVARREGDEIGDVAYKEAMAQWQQRYFTGVSEKHGFSAEGPGRKRLTRGEWYQAKIAAKFAQLDAR
jgi:hypothetical protein